MFLIYPQKESNNMTMVTQPGKPGRPKGSFGNGKTAVERIARDKRNFAVEQNRIELQAQAAQALIQQQADERRREQRERVHGLYKTQEDKRAPQFQIDQRGTLFLLGGLSIVMFIATAVLTADGTIGSSAAAKYAVPWFGYLLFGSIEVAILVFLLVYYVLGSRIDYDGRPIRSTQWFVAMVVASVIAVGLSAYHVLDEYQFDFTKVDLWVGVGIRLTTTVFFVLCSKAVANVLFARAIRL